LPLFSYGSSGPQTPAGPAPGSGGGPSVPQRPKPLTVSELTARIRGVLEPSFSEVWLQGEVSNCRPAASGHLYFSLKDAGATISAAAFRWGSRRRPFEVKDGLQVICRGRISVYPPRGNYQISVDQIEPLGAGALTLAFEQLKARLQAEGLFDPARKRSLPPFPRRIAVITSPGGAVIQDMLNILRRRAPHLRVTVIPALVQGDEAPRQLIRGLEVVQKHSLGDIVVLARGGGSMEDLWCFNDEGLARAIAACRLPVISAVGHEIDFTISDFVSDLRAPTPSAAAEIVSGYWLDASSRLAEWRDRMESAMLRDLSNRGRMLELIAARVVSPRDRLREQAQRCDDLSMRLERAMRQRLEQRRSRLEQFAGKLGALSPLRVLERGYVILRESGGADGKPGKLVRSASEVRSGTQLKVIFHDGEATVQGV